jgi:hypothetical protein
VFALDLIVLGIVIGVLISAITFFAIGKNSIAKQIDFSATIAPADVISGASSTLIIDWHNTSSEELRNAKVSLSYPAHFMLQDLSFLDRKIENNTVEIGDVLPDGKGSLKVTGVMFGDVGGKQMFTSSMEFRHGEKNKLGAKEVRHVFSPTKSALGIDVSMPNTIVSEQTVRGILRVTNSGSVDFSEIAINPTQSILNFTVSSPRTEAYEKKIGDQLVWVIPKLDKNESVEVSFTGTAPARDEKEEEEWSFDASFTFDRETFFQSRTRTQFDLIPSPISITQETGNQFITPGGKLSVSGEILNVSNEEIELKNIFIESSSPFIARRDGDSATYDIDNNRWIIKNNVSDTLAAGEKINFNAILDIKNSIQTSATNTYENLTAKITSGTEFEIVQSKIEATISSDALNLSITSPIIFNSFARYSTAQGDQIGRGPLPPVVGEETKYWVFWNISGTTNELKNVEITATLPQYARLGKKQTTSIGRQVSINGDGISWRVDSIPATFAPQSKTINLAFEVAITPSEEHVGNALTLLDNIQLTAVDAFTGEVLHAYGARISTDIADDDMASGLSRVERF